MTGTIPPPLPLRRSRRDPEPVCPVCGGSARRHWFEHQNWWDAHWRCDLHGAIEPRWADRIQEDAPHD
jgi:hypothetical protein